MYDIHVHSTFSPDGVSDFEEYAKLIEDGKVEAIGFTEHVDFLPECGAYNFFNYKQFMKSIKKYKGLGLEFYAGAEVDFAERVEKDILNHLSKNKYEYIIFSVHMINGLSVSNNRDILNINDKSTMKDMIEKYYHEVTASLEIEKFDVMGHLGVYKRYLGEEYFKRKGLHGWIAELDNSIAKLCAQRGKIVEVNSSGLFSPINSTIPGPDFLKLYYKYGGRLVSIGSDAHCADHVARGFNDVREVLKSIGFKYTILPWSRQEIKL